MCHIIREDFWKRDASVSWIRYQALTSKEKAFHKPNKTMNFVVDILRLADLHREREINVNGKEEKLTLHLLGKKKNTKK